jgi:hypothetical protein
MTKSIDYGNLMHRAMRGLIQTVLRDVAANGLPGAHHFFITFDTTVEGVEIADWLRARDPSEMTIVIQHWFDNLTVTDDLFTITLKLATTPEPRSSLDACTFVDPSVEFGLRFESHDEDDESEEDEEDPEDDPEPPQHDAQVVSLDKFRKH